MSTNYRISATTDTIPLSVGLNGSVTTNSLDSKVLDYSGTSDLNSIFSIEKVGVGGFMWIFVAASTPQLAKVISVFNTGENTYSIFLDRPMTGASSSAAKYVEATLLAYTYQNDGGATGTANGINVLNGEGYSEPQDGRGGAGDYLWVSPVVIGASSTSFLVFQTT